VTPTNEQFTTTARVRTDKTLNPFLLCVTTLYYIGYLSYEPNDDMAVNTLRTGLLNCLNARSRGLIFRHRASCV